MPRIIVESEISKIIENEARASRARIKRAEKVGYTPRHPRIYQPKKESAWASSYAGYRKRLQGWLNGLLQKEKDEADYSAQPDWKRKIR